MALSIVGKSTKNISKVVRDLNKNSQFVTPLSPKLHSNFTLVKLIMNDEIKLTGVFKKSVTLDIIFIIGAKILHIPKEYVLIKDLSNPDLRDLIQNYNFDSNKKIEDLMESDSQYIEYEIMLNYKKYGELIAIKIFDKFMESYDLEIDELKHDFEKKYSRKMFLAIFAEINSYENIYPMYGKLFKKVRKTILRKIE